MRDIDRPPVGVLPVLPSADVGEALAFYTETLGFREVFRQPGPDGTLMNGCVAFAGGQVMLNHNPEMASHKGGGVYLWFRLLDDDIDTLYQTLLARGVTVVEELGDRFWGDRSFTIADHAGYHLAFNKSLPEG